MVAAGQLDERTAVAALQEAGLASGLTVSEIGDATTIGSGLRNGRVVA
jgi:hypothetical protein